MLHATGLQGRTAGEGGRNEGRVGFAVVVSPAVAVATVCSVLACLAVGVFRTDALAEKLQSLVLYLVPSMQQELLEDARLPDDMWHMSEDEVARPLRPCHARAVGERQVRVEGPVRRRKKRDKRQIVAIPWAQRLATGLIMTSRPFAQDQLWRETILGATVVHSRDVRPCVAMLEAQGRMAVWMLAA
jgi:hypothetical protein